MTIEQRHDRDLGPALDTTDALAPLVDAVRRLGESLDRALKLAENRSDERRRTERDAALVEMVDAAFQKIGRRTSAHRFYTEQSGDQ